MSKAFTKESEADDDLPDEPDPLPAGFKNYITPPGLRRLQDELRRLVRVDRPKLVETVSWAASNGDRSENGDYIYGKRRLREIDRRIDGCDIQVAHCAENRVSWISPVARALLKAREGDVIDLRTPAGVDTIEVLAIRYETSGER